MFDIGATELLLIVVVAILVIGPKDMPLAMRTAGRWIGKIRKVSGHFRAGLDAMVREAELEDMEKKWKAQNEKIMRDHPGGGDEMEPTGAYPPARPGEAARQDQPRIAGEKRSSAEAGGADSMAAKPEDAQRSLDLPPPQNAPEHAPENAPQKKRSGDAD